MDQIIEPEGNIDGQTTPGEKPIAPAEAAAPAVSANTKRAELEALLFYYGEPISIPRAAKLIGISASECKTLIQAWSDSLAGDSERGLVLMQNGDEVQLATKPALKSIGEALIKEEFREELTPAGFETLSLIAYLGPITRPRIDYIRGVNSSFTVRNLLMRGLIERTHGDEKGHLFEYAASMQFLKHMGVSSAHDLPEYAKYHALLGDLETQRTESSRLEEQPIPETPIAGEPATELP
jgi:segregation and condensation protein B